MVSVLPRRRRSFLQYLIDANPFYLASAACMLLACLLLSNTTTWSPIAANKLVMLIVTLNAYELLIVGLGLFLIAWRNDARDGLRLVCIEAVFITDVGFLGSELYTENLQLGLAVNSVLLVLGLAKLTAMFKALKMSLRSPVFGLNCLLLFVMLAHPALFRWIGGAHQGRLPDEVMYLAWWAFGALLAAYSIVYRMTRPSRFRGTRADSRRCPVGHILLTLMTVSLAAHFGTAHWIYSSTFQAADVAPVLLALAVVLANVRGNGFVRRADARVLSGVLPLAAIFVSLQPSNRLETVLAHWHLSPLMLAGVAAYLTWLGCFLPRYFGRGAVVGIGGAMLYAFGPTWASIQRFLSALYDAIITLADRLMPHTQGAWGTVALAAAFILLGIGAAVSLMRTDKSKPTVKEATSVV
jgi:hypothetical protein